MGAEAVSGGKPAETVAKPDCSADRTVEDPAVREAALVEPNLSVAEGKGMSGLERTVVDPADTETEIVEKEVRSEEPVMEEGDQGVSR